MRIPFQTIDIIHLTAQYLNGQGKSGGELSQMRKGDQEGGLRPLLVPRLPEDVAHPQAHHLPSSSRHVLLVDGGLDFSIILEGVIHLIH